MTPRVDGESLCVDGSESVHSAPVVGRAPHVVDTVLREQLMGDYARRISTWVPDEERSFA